MDGEPDIARAAALIADGSRASILKALSGGRVLTVTALAAEAGVGAPTASAHLTRLLAAGMVVAERAGRTKNYRLASPEITTALEALAVIAPPLPIGTLRQSTRTDALRRSRTCYDHLAGRLGVALMGALLEAEVITGRRARCDVLDRPAAYGREMDYRLTTAGTDALRAFGVDLDGLPPRRAVVRYCVDWSERRHHLAGAVGAALTARLFALGWIRHGASPRAVLVTDAGAAGLATTFGVAPNRWRGGALTS